MSGLFSSPKAPRLQQLLTKMPAKGGWQKLRKPEEEGQAIHDINYN